MSADLIDLLIPANTGCVSRLVFTFLVLGNLRSVEVPQEWVIKGEPEEMAPTASHAQFKRTVFYFFQIVGFPSTK